jgi:hypothetical protein
MTKTTLAELLHILISCLVINQSFNKKIYLKDGEDNWHIVTEIDLMSDRFRCEDGYFDYYECIDAIGNLYVGD